MALRSVAWRLLMAAAVLLVVGWLVSLGAVIERAGRDEARKADAIVVLGAAQYSGRPSPVLRARLDHAIALWRRGLAPRLVLTGGRGPGDTVTEAEVGRRYAERNGVPDSALLVETEGRTTRQSLQAVAVLLNPSQRSVVLVSDPFHALRLSILARRLGLEPHTSPTRTSPISRNRSQRWRYVLGESVKVPVAFLLER